MCKGWSIEGALSGTQQHFGLILTVIRFSDSRSGLICGAKIPQSKMLIVVNMMCGCGYV